ncbi:dipicolinate synthase subunit B [Salicibibacter halophilus]|uniref:Dipicolinate synthase subunit B n=1 Tax=Salicibibacter halophilus TaxID=2502791 RepID=A0A514LEH0_9BACI|nr:dipicolinate synthase subunit B [Salicibibacter halophilus]QDI90253.1 dipicolinate synthase subunit B [Salicibibacter halophilus]
MMLVGKRVGFGLTGSHCTLEEVIPMINGLKDEGAEVIPFVSFTIQTTETKFGTPNHWLDAIEKAAGHEAVDSIPKAEPYGPKTPLDAMLIAPMTGSSMSKFANAQNDSPVLMAAKATLRNSSPIVLAISTNDALGLNATNLAKLLQMHHVYFVPLGQDNPYKKPTSLVARMEDIPQTIEAAIRGEQYQPLFIEKFND